MTDWPIHGRIDGPLVMIGFGSIGRGSLPLILRHFALDRARITIIDPDEENLALAQAQGVAFKTLALTQDNFRDVLTPLLSAGPGRAFLVNLSVDVSSTALMELCAKTRSFYIDTVAEPWLGHYVDPKLSISQRSNYALRESVLSLRQRLGKTATAINCCGANPGMVSWFVKQALLNIAADLGVAHDKPATRADWANLMRNVGVKGIHIAERDTQRSLRPKPRNVFINTWSVEGFIAEGLQPAELGWGTHEKALPPEGRTHDFGCGAGIYLMRPGAGTKVRTWTPTARAQHGFLITHNEAISIADHYTVREEGKVVYRPTCHYAYHPCDDAILSLHEMSGAQWQRQSDWHILEENEITGGRDELGVLLYGHARNAYWYGSQLTIDETRKLAPHQNATGLQVTSAVLAGMAYALAHPDEGILEADEMDFAKCLDIQRPYLGTMTGTYTDWTPVKDRGLLFPENLDTDDPWQFSNVIVRG